jgi:hypothetical protein
MSNQNEGKVLLGTDGNPLLSADGKIVLASDSTYQSRQVWPYTDYRRLRSSTLPADAIADIWGGAWGTSGTTGAQHTVSSPTVIARHWVRQYTPPSIDNVDWARVKKISYQLYLSWSRKVSVPPMAVTKSQGNSTIPTNTDIRDVWDVAASFDTAWTGGQLTKVEWIVDGVRPDSVEFAVIPTSTSCGTYDGALTWYTNITYLDIVYNLATA